MIHQQPTIEKNDVVRLPGRAALARVELVDGDIAVVSEPMPTGGNIDLIKLKLHTVKASALTVVIRAADMVEQAQDRRPRTYSYDKDAARKRKFYAENRDRIRAYHAQRYRDMPEEKKEAYRRKMRAQRKARACEA